MVKAYLARAMSGRVMLDVVIEAGWCRDACELAGIMALDPVQVEGVKPRNRKLQSTKKQMDVYWKRDKEMIREAHVFIDCTPHLKSQGVEREAGYARYSLWKPIIRIFPKGQIPPRASVAHYEDDVIVDSFTEALQIINKRWGTYWKRLVWRGKLLFRCLPRWLRYQLGEFK